MKLTYCVRRTVFVGISIGWNCEIQETGSVEVLNEEVLVERSSCVRLLQFGATCRTEWLPMNDRCHEIKSPPKQSLPLTDMKSPPETLYRNKVSPIEIESPVYDTKSLPSENRLSSLGCIFYNFK